MRNKTLHHQKVREKCFGLSWRNLIQPNFDRNGYQQRKEIERIDSREAQKPKILPRHSGLYRLLIDIRQDEAGEDEKESDTDIAERKNFGVDKASGIEQKPAVG